MQKINKLYIPFLIFFLISFNSIIKNYTIKSVYLFFIVIGILLLLIDSNRLKRNYLIIPLEYLFLLTIVFTIQIYIFPETMIMLKGYFVYTIILVYWIFYFYKFTTEDFKKVLILTIPLVYVIAILGIIQFFISPNLFGLISTQDSLSIEWATNAEFSQYKLYFRASSILGSPQVFGLFMALYVIILVNIQYFKSSTLNRLGVFLLIFSGVLSGNKSFILILGLYLLYYVYKNLNSKIFLFYLAIGITAIVLNFDTIIEIELFERMLDKNEIVRQEKDDSRLDRYVKVISKANFFIGDGLGTRIFKKQTNLDATESYFLQILSEAGIIILLAFSFLLYMSYLLSSKNVLYDIKFLIISMIISMMFVHAFTSPIFFIFWGILMGSFSKKYTLTAGERKNECFN